MTVDASLKGVDPTARTAWTRHFLLSPQAAAIDLPWPEVPFGGSILRAHPRLNVVRARSAEVEVMLIGHLLDPLRPRLGDRQLVAEVTQQGGDLDDVYDLCADFGGSYVLLYRHRVGLLTNSFVIGDAIHSKQIYYGSRNGDVSVASSPNLLARVLGAAEDPAARPFLRSAYFRHADEPWWPGKRTRFEGIYKLLPNHALDVTTGSAQRAWPRCQIAPVPWARAVSRSAAILHGGVTAAAGRFPLALGITAGLDSRVVLAASRQVKEGVFCYTARHAYLRSGHRDLSVPSAMLHDLGLRHHVCSVPSDVDPALEAEILATVPFEKPRRIRAVSSNLKAFPEGAMLMTGHAAEVVKGAFSRLPDQQLAVEQLAGFEGMHDTYTAAAFDSWLTDFEGRSRIFGVEVLDLFYWEQRLGSWLGANFLAANISHEHYLPFNHRQLLTTLLGVAERDRRAAMPAIFHDIIADLWPRLLNYPINPTFSSASSASGRNNS